MGLLAIMNSFIFNTQTAVLNQRPQDLFCRSQIENECVASHLSLKQLLDLVSTLGEYDDFVLLVLSSAVEFIEQFQTT